MFKHFGQNVADVHRSGINEVLKYWEMYKDQMASSHGIRRVLDGAVTPIASIAIVPVAYPAGVWDYYCDRLAKALDKFGGKNTCHEIK